MLRSFAMLWVAALVLACASTQAQTIEQLRAYQNFENAKAANKISAALNYGKEAVRLTEGADDEQELIELLRNVGDYAAQAGSDEQANEYYIRALRLQEASLGPNHPDLVPILTALAGLAVKDKRYSDAEARLTRIANIERSAYGNGHENTLSTLAKLRDLYRITNNSQELARVEAQLQPPPLTNRGSLPRPGEIAGKDRHYQQNGQGFATVRVFYGTNRAPTGEMKPTQYYGTA